MEPLRILIVEDEPEVRSVLAEYLLRGGHEVAAMASGREALDHLDAGAEPFDVAVVDWHLPGITGRDVIEGLRERSPETIIVLSTGEVTELLHPGGQGDGWDDVVHKPYSLREFRARIEEHGARRRSQKSRNS